MRKLALLFIMVATAIAVVSCSKDLDDEDAKVKCRFNAFRIANGNPEVTNTTADYDGKPCRQIEYDCKIDTMQAFGPAKLGGGTPLIKLCTLFDEDEIIIFDTTLKDPTQTPTYYRIVFANGDAMYFDLYIEPNIKNGNISYIRTKYQCVHVK